MRACSPESLRTAGAASDARSCSSAAAARCGSAHGSNISFDCKTSVRTVRDHIINFARASDFIFLTNSAADARMIACFDIGNTHTHLGLANSRRVLRHRGRADREWERRLDQIAALIASILKSRR